MKKTLLFFFVFFLAFAGLHAQSFTDDFESYNVGDYIAATSPDWTTWSNAPGGAEDVQVTDVRANSGSNAIYFESNSGNGGPADIVLPFGGTYTEGTFEYTMSLYIPSDGGGYFNIQRTMTAGTGWEMNAYFDRGGIFRATNSSNTALMSTSYPVDTWFTFTLTADLTTKNWKVTVDGECRGSFGNPNVASIASIDLYPLNGHKFFVDDVRYNYTGESTPIQLDASVTGVSLGAGGLEGQKKVIKGQVNNNGTDEITSFDITVDNGTTSFSESYSGLSIAGGESYEFELEEQYVVIAGINEVDVIVSNINGGADEDGCNDRQGFVMRGSVPALDKGVIAEEATGGWCGWCPRGTVALEKLTYDYPDHFIGIAVHDNDPMVNSEYDNGLGAGSFPSAKVMRGAFIDPGSMEGPFLTEIEKPAMASMVIGAEYDESSRELNISVQYTMQDAVSGDWKANVVITEDGVTGTGAAYNQANYYSFQSQGIDLFGLDGTNWRDLPNPVPAADMVYDHVARATLAGFEGIPGGFEELSVGEAKIMNFKYTIPPAYNAEKLHIISMFITPTGAIVNGKQSTIEDAVNNGFLVSNTYDIELTNTAKVFPNPFSDVVNVALDIEEASPVTISVVNIMGQQVAYRDYGVQRGQLQFTFDGANLDSGIYTLKINVGDKFTTKKVSIVR